MKPVAVLATGMITGVGLTAPATCAAIRAAVSGFRETKFIAAAGDWVIGSPVPLDPPVRGRQKLVHLAAAAVRECLAGAPGIKASATPLLLCVAEPGRPGRLDGLDDRLFAEVQDALGVQFHPRSGVIARGRVGGAVALARARQLIHDDGVARCVVAGVDSLLVGPTVTAYEARGRLLTKKHSNGFLPGEAGAAVLLGPAGAAAGPEFRCLAVGFGREPAPIESDDPLRADGLVEAFRGLGRDAGLSLDDADYRYTDCNGEQYGFKQDRLAIARTVRRLKARFDHLHPADGIGEVGAAVGPCALGLALAAARGGYAPGDGVLAHFSSDDGERAALLLRYVREERRR